MADVDVKQLMLQVDASVELLRQNLMRGDREVTRFTGETLRRLDATDRRFAQFGKPLTGIASGVARTNAQIATIGVTATRVQAQVTSAAASMRTALLTSTSGIAAAFGANQVADYSDSYVRFTNQLKVAGLEGVKLSETQERLYVIAQKYGVPLENLGQLYGSLSSLQKDLNITSADSIALTQAVAAGIKVGGVSAEKSAGAILGLNQALAQTRVQSDEYNQILDGARPLLQAAVDGTEKYGGSLAKLKQDIEAGNVSGSDLFKILSNGFDGVGKKAEKATLTIGNSFVVLNNALGKYIGEAGEASTATEKISAGIQGIANNLDLIGPALAVIGAGFATRATLPGLAKARDEVGLFIKALDDEKLVMLGSKVAAAQKAQAVAIAARAEVVEIEATIAARRADSEAIAANLVMIDRQRAAAVQAQAAIKANVAAGFGTIGMGTGVDDAARANQDLKAQIVTRRALAVANADIAASEAALAAAQIRSATATVAATAATNAATLAARAGAAASKLFAGSLTLIGGSVAGGAAVLAIGAVIGAIMLYQNSVAEAKRRDEEFVQAGKDLNDHLRQTAQYSSQAAGGVTNVGNSAASAVAGLNGMAGSAANLADNLRRVAEESRRANIEMLRSDETKAKSDLDYYTKRDSANRGARAGSNEVIVAMGGVAVPTDGADAAKQDSYYRDRKDEARRREAAAKSERERLEKAPWESFTPSASRARQTDLDMADRDQTVDRDLTIARQSGNKAQVDDLKAQKFQIDQYKKYRKDGLSADAASAQSSKDMAEFKQASGERAAAQAGVKATRDAASAKREEEAAVRDAAADARAYAAASRQADNDIAAARAALSGSAEDRANIEKARVESERMNRDQEIASQGPGGAKRYSADEVSVLQAKNKQRADLETEVVDLGERRRKAQEALDGTLDGLSSQQDIASLQAGLASTTAARRDLELRLLDIQREEEDARLRAITVAQGATEAEEKIAKARLGQLDEIYRLRRQQTEQNNESPMQRYRRQSMENVQNYGEQLETIEVSFFENLNDQLGESATRFLQLKGAAGDFFNQLIADVIRLNIQQAGGSGGLLGGLLKLGGSLLGTQSLSVSNNPSSGIPSYNELDGFAGGGFTGNIGRNKVAGLVHGQEYVFDADSTARIGRNNLEAMRNGTFKVPSVSRSALATATAGGLVRIEIGQGALFEPTITSIAGNVSAQVAASTAPVLVGAASGQAQASMAQRARRQIR